MIKKYLNRLFIDGLSGMALGLFATLIIGTILNQIGTLIGGPVGSYFVGVSQIAKTITGAGIGVGVASKFKSSPLVTISAAVAGMIGAFPDVINFSKFGLGAAGEPLGAFVAAYVAIEIGSLVTGKTKLDIILTPFVSIASGALVGIFIGPYISTFMTWVGNLINVNVDKHPIVGGMIISVLMGIALTLPISSAAIGVSMQITGLAAGAATIGCCCQMVGFAVASYRENKVGGLIAQGVGTSMLQMPNIIKNPLIWLPPIISSAILGPISSAVLKMTSTPIGSGMGSAGLVGQFAAYESMAASGMHPALVLIEILVMHFVLPAALTLAIAEGLRKAGWIKKNDMLLSVN
ncbi:MAG: PTS sugar transporter subunit IIC [Lachnospiraceae bacterium]|nr:PTS sugar transporter subunit IIC [Lachnospiraceae bacterium]